MSCADDFQQIEESKVVRRLDRAQGDAVELKFAFCCVVAVPLNPDKIQRVIYWSHIVTSDGRQFSNICHIGMENPQNLRIPVRGLGLPRFLAEKAVQQHNVATGSIDVDDIVSSTKVVRRIIQAQDSVVEKTVMLEDDVFPSVLADQASSVAERP
jgi:hypothetical protein